MRALLRDAAPVQHDEAVHELQRRQAVRDGDDRLSLHQHRQGFLDRRLDLGIERRGRLVEDEDRGVLQDHARDRNALALSARELDAALADMRVERAPSFVILEERDELGRVGAACGVDHLLFARARPPVEDVLADRAVAERNGSCVTTETCARRLSCATKAIS